MSGPPGGPGNNALPLGASMLQSIPRGSTNVPAYISVAPWYGESGSSTQGKPEAARPSGLDGLRDLISKPGGVKRGKCGRAKVVTGAFQEGSCVNCGAPSHTASTCLERPRALRSQARTTGIASHVEEVHRVDKTGSKVARTIPWDAKRDGYRDWEAGSAIEVLRVKQHELGGHRDDEVMLRDEQDVVREVLDERNQVSTKNLRIREDVAKYLKNVDAGPVPYDPKTRALHGVVVDRSKDEELVAVYQAFSYKVFHESGDRSLHASASPTLTAMAKRNYDEGVLRRNFGRRERVDVDRCRVPQRDREQVTGPMKPRPDDLNLKAEE